MPRKYVIYDRLKRPKLKHPEMTGEYTDYEIKLIKKSTGPGEDDFEVEEKVIEHKTNIKEFINSFSKSVGVHALIEQIAKTGDMSLLNQRPEIHADLSQIPDNPGEALEAARSVEEAFAKIDPALTKGMKYEDFINNLTPEQLEKYIQEQIALRTKAKEGDKQE